MGLKILHSADWHLDTPFLNFSQEQRSFLQAEQRKIPGRIGELAAQYGVDLVLLSGDLFDGQPKMATVDLVRNALGSCGVPVFISPGNHDFCSPDSPWILEKWPENVHIFTGAWESVTLEALDCRVYGAGYRSMDCPALLQDFRAEGEERYCVAVLHGDPLVKNSPCCPVTNAQVRESGLNYLALGHIHKAGAFRSGDTLCAWPGCPMGRGWDETGDKGLCIVTLEDTAQIQPVSLGLPQFWDWEVEINGSGAEELEAALPPQGNRDFYRITLTGVGQVDLETLARKFSAFPNLELRSRVEAPMPIWQNAEEDSLRGMYLRLLRDSRDPRAELTAEISQRLLAGREVRLP